MPDTNRALLQAIKCKNSNRIKAVKDDKVNQQKTRKNKSGAKNKLPPSSKLCKGFPKSDKDMDGSLDGKVLLL